MKKNIVNAVKVLLLLFMMTNGFFLTYAFIWRGVGLPLTGVVLALLYVLACITECGYCAWLKENGTEGGDDNGVA